MNGTRFYSKREFDSIVKFNLKVLAMLEDPRCVWNFETSPKIKLKTTEPAPTNLMATVQAEVELRSIKIFHAIAPIQALVTSEDYNNHISNLHNYINHVKEKQEQRGKTEQ